jgi:hypothetical protein
VTSTISSVFIGAPSVAKLCCGDVPQPRRRGMDLRLYALGKDEGPAAWFFNQLVVVKASPRPAGSRDS